MLLLYCVSSGRLRQANFTKKRNIRRCKVSRIVKMIHFGTIFLFIHYVNLSKNGKREITLIVVVYYVIIFTNLLQVRGLHK